MELLNMIGRYSSGVLVTTEWSDFWSARSNSVWRVVVVLDKPAAIIAERTVDKVEKATLDTEQKVGSPSLCFDVPVVCLLFVPRSEDSVRLSQ